MDIHGDAQAARGGVSVALLGRPGKGSLRRSGEYRRRGPGRRNALARVLSGARGNRRGRRSSSPTASQWALIAVLAPAVGLVVARRRLHVPPAATLAVASAAPLVVAAATPRRAWRYVAVCATYMWTFTVTWTLPYDEPERLRQRLADSVPGKDRQPDRSRCAADPPFAARAARPVASHPS